MALRILHVLDHSVPLQAGYAFRTLEILREQRRLGWETAHLTTPKHYGSKADIEEAEGFTFHRTRPPDAWFRRAPILNQVMVVTDTARRLDPLVRDWRPDIIHAHSPALNGLAALRVGRRHGIPVVYEMRASWEDAAVDHGTTIEGSVRYRLSRAMETHVLRRAAAITTICEGLRRDILARGGIDPKRVTVIPNAVNAADFAVITTPDAALAARLNLGAGPVLGFVGSFYGYEGIDVLLDAMPSLAHAFPGLAVLLVGGGPVEGELRAQAERLGIAGRVHFTGRVPHGEVTRYYSLIDLLVYARKSMRLTELVTPLKPLEAMAQGRMFMASDVGGHRELVPGTFQDRLFKAGDAGDLARAAQRLLAERGTWSGSLAAARQHVAEERSWQGSVSRYAAVYAAAAAAAAARSR